jgi:hypothetical protein
MKWYYSFCFLISIVALMAANLFGGVERGQSPLGRPLPANVKLKVLQSNVSSALPFSENFDGGLGSWTATGMWNIPANPSTVKVLNPDIHPTLVILPEPPGSAFIPQPTSGNGMAWFGEAATGTFLGTNFNIVIQDPLNGGTSDSTLYGWLVSPPIDMTTAGHALLEFKTAWEIEGVDVNSYDLMQVGLSTDGGNFWDLVGVLNPLNDVDGESWKPYSSGGLAQPITWITHTFDLSGYVGNTVLLGFYFDSGDQLYNGFRGWFLDDVSITDNAIPAPDITSIVPSTSAAGEIVDILGQNFANGATIEVGGNFVLSSVFSTTLAEMEVPFLSPGQYDVKLTNPDGQFDLVVNGLTITSDAPPTAFFIDPDSAVVGTSVAVTISGSDFQTGANATIGGISLGNLMVVNDFTITGNSPSGLPGGVYTVVVTNPDGQFDQLPGAFTVYNLTGIEDNSFLHPTDFTLLQNYPNPFNPSTKIEFQIPDAAFVKLTVYNLAGQEVANLLNAYRPAGAYSIEFDAGGLPSGIYFYRLVVGNNTMMKKMILMK